MPLGLTMNYLLIYDVLIEKAQNREKPKGYTEKHHIIPRSLGGSDDNRNIVILTAREHFVAHCLLARIYGGSQYFSVLMFISVKRYANSRLIASAREKSATGAAYESRVQRIRDIAKTDEYKQLRSTVTANMWKKGKLNKHTTDKMINTLKENANSPEWIQMISEKTKQAMQRPEVKEKLSVNVKAAMQRPEVKEKHRIGLLNAKLRREMNGKST